MKKLLFILATGLISSVGLAQKLPVPSPSAKLEQTVGLTELSIEYSRPGVKGRTIFGDLVPYDAVWRLGANACTKFTCSTDIIVLTEVLKAGTYAMFATPINESIWKIHFNSDTEQWGAGNYDATKDVLTVMVKAKPNVFTETFTLAIKDITLNSATLSILWADTKVNIPLEINTEKIAQKNIDNAIKKGENLDKVYYKAANYYFKVLKDQKKALSYIHKGLNIKKTYGLYFLRGQILNEQGHTKEAIESAQEALALAVAEKNKDWADYIEENIKEWKK